MNSPEPWVIVAGTGFDGRAALIRKHCEVGKVVDLRRDPANTHDPNAIGVWMECSTWFGLKTQWLNIGFVKADRAKSWAPKLDSGRMVITRAHVRSFHAPPELEVPRVSLAVRAEYPKG